MLKIIAAVLAFGLMGHSSTEAAMATQLDQPAAQPPKVVLLHGLARGGKSMQKLSDSLASQGYETCNVSYPSRKYGVEQLASEHVLPAISECFSDDLTNLNFVTHSMGGIIVRQLAVAQTPIEFARVVMLSPPNSGSEVVDVLQNVWPFGLINGPAGKQLGTSANSLPPQLGPATFEVGIITGNRSINPILSMMIKGKDDGKVSVQSARLEGMSDFIVMPVTHTFIMKNRKVIDYVAQFLQTGRFDRMADNAKSPSIDSASDYQE